MRPIAIVEVLRTADSRPPGTARAIGLDVSSQESVDRAVEDIMASAGRLDVIVHNAGHMVLGPLEAFTPEQLASIYDVNVIGASVSTAQRPHLREQGSGQLVWVGSTSTRGGCPPFLGPYFPAKAAGDALAVSYAGELIRFGIDTTIVLPGAFASGTNHFANAGAPEDTQRANAYEDRYGELQRDLPDRLGSLVPDDADAREVADEIARIGDLPGERRPFRVHIDPSHDGSQVVGTVGDRIGTEFFKRVGIEDLLAPTSRL